MTKEFKIAGFVFSAIFFIFSSVLIWLAFDTLSYFNKVSNLKTNGREVQATIYDWHTATKGDSAYYTPYIVHYAYEEDGREWSGSIQYSEDDRTTSEDYLSRYYESMIGEKVNLTIDPDSNFSLLTNNVETSYRDSRLEYILQFSFGGVCLLATTVLFIVFLVWLKKDNKPSNCSFIKNKED